MEKKSVPSAKSKRATDLRTDMKAAALLKRNIDTLLRARRQTRKDLAQWCRRSESWISKVFRHEQREIPLKYLDRIADFFGLATYQLFQPGISALTERRMQIERRAGRDRRQSHAHRVMLELTEELRRHRRRRMPTDTEARDAHAEVSPSASTIEEIVTDFEGRIDRALDDAESGKQAPVARPPQPRPRPRRKPRGRRDDPPHPK